MDLRDLMRAGNDAFSQKDDIRKLFPTSIIQPSLFGGVIESMSKYETPFIQTSKMLVESLQDQTWYQSAAMQLSKYAQTQSEIFGNKTVTGAGLALSQVVSRMLPPYSSLLSASQQFSEAFAKVSEDFKGPAVKLQEIMANAIPDTHLAGLYKVLSNYSESFWLQLDDTQRRAFKLFAKLALVGLEGHLTHAELSTVLKIHRAKGKDAVLKYIFSKFRRNKYRLLNEMSRRWWRAPYLAKRKKTIRAALKAHKLKMYELSIPTLLPLVDGLAAEFMPKLPKHKIQVKEAVELYHEYFGEWASECVLTVVKTVMYKTVDFNRPKQRSSINRHAVLHGNVVEYASESNSYRVILMLDMMFNIYEEQHFLTSKSSTP